MLRAILGVFLIGCGGTAPEHREIVDLHDEFDDGHVVLTSASGNGSSSGSAVTGQLVANTTSALRVSVSLRRPIYLANSGRGQSMIALQVYMSDNRYTSDGTTAFITLPPGAATPVVFVAFCMDFEKDNPTARDRLSVSQVPSAILPVVANVNQYLATNPDADVTSAAQTAIWLAQGVNIRTIRSRFTVTAADEALARRFLM